jgi:hypothetical protein
VRHGSDHESKLSCTRKPVDGRCQHKVVRKRSELLGPHLEILPIKDVAKLSNGLKVGR